MNTAEAILTRRSTRSFLNRKVERGLIDKIVKAGRYAPSGGNNQTNHFFVIQDEDVLKKIRQIAMDAFSRMEVYEGMYRSLMTSVTLSKKGNYVYDYGAPCLIVIANRKDYGNNRQDMACALENMLIMANELDLGSCYINQLYWLNEDEKILELFRSFGLKDDERIYGSLVIGYPDSEDGLPKRVMAERKGNEVTYIG